MKRYLPIVAIVLTLAGALAVLTLTHEDIRRWWFRGYVVLVGVLVARWLLGWLGAQPRTLQEFRRFRRPRWPRRRRSLLTSRRGSERVLHLAEFSAGDAHRGLRPLLQEIAAERLRAGHGIDLTDPRAGALLAPATWDLVRPDRPTPHDRRAPGLSPAAIDALLDDLEAL